MHRILMAACAALGACAGDALAQPGAPDEAAFRALYEEMVEIDTSASTGSCTRAVEAVAARLRAVGYAEGDVRIIAPVDRPNDGNLIATLQGSGRGGLLLLAHIDVVDARREDWERDPFTLVEEDGFFYGRGTGDDKAMAAVFADLLIRLRQENFRPRRDIKMALTCGEEGPDPNNGLAFLVREHRDLLDADFAINEGAGGVLDEHGQPIALQLQAGEKIHQIYQLEVTHEGGHSSRPVPENAIYRLSAALTRVAALEFPFEINEAARGYFGQMAAIVGGETGAAMARLAADPNDTESAALLARDLSNNALMHTTCAATQLEAGHATNALPQRARATLSCRILQGHTPEEIQAALQRAIGDPQVSVTIVDRRDGSNPPPLTSAITGPVERAAARLWPGVPIVPTMTAGASDGRFLNAAGIPTYGMSGMFSVPGENFAHGLNERIRVRSVFEGRAFLDSVVREYAMQR